MTGVIALLSVVTLRQAGGGADALVAGQALVAVYNWAFLFGPGFMACVNALLLGSLLYRSGLVPRIIPLVGLTGAPLLFASDLAVMFGLWEQVFPARGDRNRPDRASGRSPSAPIWSSKASSPRPSRLEWSRPESGTPIRTAAV